MCSLIVDNFNYGWKIGITNRERTMNTYVHVKTWNKFQPTFRRIGDLEFWTIMGRDLVD